MNGARENAAASGQWMPLPKVMALAEEHRRAGRLAEAEGVCGQILRAKPDNAEATHLLGLVAHQAGNEETARLLASVVDVVDEATGTVRLKKKVDAAAEMALDTRSTKTVRVRKG